MCKAYDDRVNIRDCWNNFINRSGVKGKHNIYNRQSLEICGLNGFLLLYIPIWNLIHYRKSIFTFAFIFILSVTPASSLRARRSTDPSRKEQSIRYKEGGEPFYVHYISLITEKMSSCKISPMGRETVLQSSISKLTILSDAKWIHLKPIKNKQKPKLFTHFSTNSFENRIHFGLIAHQNERETMIFQHTWAK